MLKQSPRRNQTNVNFIYGFQIFLSLAISVWLLYQVKHFYDKAYRERSAKVPEMLKSGDVIFKLGRKHMHIGKDAKLGERIKEGDIVPKDTVQLSKGGEDDDRDEASQERAEDEEELEDIEDLIDEEDKDVDEVSEELEPEEKENDKTSNEGRRAQLLLAAKAEII